MSQQMLLAGIQKRDDNNCDWLWENPPVTHKDKYLEIHNSKCNISRRLKAACLQFATNL